MFFFLFYLGFRNQSYYYINLMILPIFVFVSVLVILKNNYLIVFNSYVFKLIVIAFLIMNIYHTKVAMTEIFYNGGWRHARLNSAFYEPKFKKYFNELGIDKTDRIISLPDGSPNASLYILNRTGWSNYGFPNNIADSAAMANLINEGAKYLVLANDELPNEQVLKPFTKVEIGKYKNIHIYNLVWDGITTIKSSDKVTFKGFKLKSISCGLNWELTVSGSSDLETFSLIHLGNNKIALKANNGKYVSNEHTLSGKLIANRDAIGAWETFEVTYLGEEIALKADNGKYVAVNENNPNELIANTDTISERTLFKIEVK